jgi:GNAT superfamily N-acetyltransferase
VDLGRRLAAELPDEPRWLETRAMLLTGHARIIGGDSIATGFVVRLVHGALSVVAVVGQPARDAIAQAVADVTDFTPIIAQTADRAHVGDGLQSSWTCERAILHRLRAVDGRVRQDDRRVQMDPPYHPGRPPAVRLLTRNDSLVHLPAGLRHEITHARAFAPIAGVFVDGVPVSFCYPAWVTERLWDVSIDTLEAHRGQSLGAKAVRFMIELMAAEGREPVWGALESNAASLRLGAKLGFVPAGDLVVFSRGGWVFLSGGFSGASETGG